MQSLGVRTIFDYRSTDLSKISKRFDVAYDTAAVMTPRMGTGLLNKGGVYLDINPTPARFIRSPFDRRLKPIVAQHQHRLRHRVAGALAAGSRWPLHFRPHPGNQRQRARAARVCLRRRLPHLGQPFERRWADLDGLGDEGLGRVSLKRIDEEGSMRSLALGACRWRWRERHVESGLQGSEGRRQPALPVAMTLLTRRRCACDVQVNETETVRPPANLLAVRAARRAAFRRSAR